MSDRWFDFVMGLSILLLAISIFLLFLAGIWIALASEHLI